MLQAQSLSILFLHGWTGRIPSLRFHCPAGKNEKTSYTGLQTCHILAWHPQMADLLRSPISCSCSGPSSFPPQKGRQEAEGRMAETSAPGAQTLKKGAQNGNCRPEALCCHRSGRALAKRTCSSPFRADQLKCPEQPPTGWPLKGRRQTRSRRAKLYPEGARWVMHPSEGASETDRITHMSHSVLGQDSQQRERLALF